MRRFVAALGIASLATGIIAEAQQRNPDPPRRGFLFKDARGEIAAARARGDTTLLLVIASMPAQNAKVVRRVTQLGGSIRFRDDDVDYLRVRLPVDSVDRLIGDALIHSADVSISRMSRAFGLADALQPNASRFASDALPSLPADTLKQRWPCRYPKHLSSIAMTH
jgi:hypothetical protein